MEQRDDFDIDVQSDLANGDGEAVPLKSRFAGLYREDVVQSAGQSGVMGMVTKVAGDSEASSSDGESDDGAESILEGCARVCWTNLEESTEKIEDIRVVDRAFMHGDIVAAVSSPLGQIGTIVNVDLKVDLELPNREVVKGVDSKKIKRIRHFEPGDYVIHDHWLGRVDEVDDNVTVLFDDGSKCKVVRADSERLCPLSTTPVDDANCPYYPGLQVRANSSALFKTARWLKGSWKATRMEGTVINVEVGSVMVYWIAAAHTGYKSQPAAIPSEQQDPKSLKRMVDLSYTGWQLGDRALAPQSLARKCLGVVQHPHDGPHQECEEIESQEIATLTQASASSDLGSPFAPNIKDTSLDSWVTYRRRLKKGVPKHRKKSLKKHDVTKTAALVVGTKTKVEVVWQNGTHDRDVDSCSLFPVDHLGEHDFWPDQYVLEKGVDLEGVNSEPKRTGIIKSVDAKQRTAKVKWLMPFDKPEEGPQFKANEDTVSVYELVEHPDYSYSLGDVVIRLCSSGDVTSECSVKETDTASSSNNDGKFETDGDVNAENEHKVGHSSALQKFRKPQGNMTSTNCAWVGVILGLEDGDIKVAWADGKISKVGPQAIFVVGRDDDESNQTSDIGIIEDIDDTGSWTTVESTTEANEGQELGQSDRGENLELKESSESSGDTTQREESPTAEGASHGLGSALMLPFVALIRALRFAAGLLWALRGSRTTSGLGQGIGSSGVKGLVQGNGGLEIQLDESDGNVLESSFNHTQVQDNVESVVMDERQELISQEGVETHVSNEANKSASGCPVEFENRDMQERLAEHPCAFKQFDSVKDSSDHHFTSEVIQWSLF